jgi:hypothetical protein
MFIGDTIAAAYQAGRTPGAIRNWARRGLITRQPGTGPHGSALWDLEEVAEVAARITSDGRFTAARQPSRRRVDGVRCT